MRDFIDDCLKPDPSERPPIEQILNDDRYPFLEYAQVFERDRMNRILNECKSMDNSFEEDSNLSEEFDKFIKEMSQIRRVRQVIPPSIQI